MENIRQAIERAQSQRAGAPLQSTDDSALVPPTNTVAHTTSGAPLSRSVYREAALNSDLLQANRIIAHVVTDPRTRSFDMLRTQIMQLMDQKKWRTIAITSPTPGCGKTVTALNLALSIARQPGRQVFFMDMDFIKPMGASSLGLSTDADLKNVLKGKATLSSATINARVGEQQFLVAPCTATSGSSELLASRAMTTLFQDLKREFSSHTIIIDLPPILSSDDVITVLPQVDCVILVVAIGTSTLAQIEDCKKHLQTAEVARVVVNKVPETNNQYYYY